MRTLHLVQLSGRPASFIGEMISEKLTSLIGEAVELGDWDAVRLVPPDR